MVSLTSPVRESYSRTVPSGHPTAIVCPSGLNSAEKTLAVGPFNAEVFYAKSLSRPTALSSEGGHTYFRFNASF